MCGVFGFVAEKGRKMDLKAVLRVATATEERGRDAFGFAWVDSRGVIRSFRQKGRISDHLAILAMARDAVMMIGHTRWTTSGTEEQNINTHPHACDGGWLVHNGVVQGHRDLADEHDLLLSSECDSEIIARLIEDAPTGDRLARTAWAVRQTSPGPLVVLGLWSGELVVCRRGNPLSLSIRREGLYLASIGADLPGKAEPVEDGTVRLLTRDQKGAIHGTIRPIAGTAYTKTEYAADRVTGGRAPRVRGEARARADGHTSRGAR